MPRQRTELLPPRIPIHSFPRRPVDVLRHNSADTSTCQWTWGFLTSTSHRRLGLVCFAPFSQGNPPCSLYLQGAPGIRRQPPLFLLEASKFIDLFRVPTLSSFAPFSENLAKPHRLLRSRSLTWSLVKFIKSCRPRWSHPGGDLFHAGVSSCLPV